MNKDFFLTEYPENVQRFIDGIPQDTRKTGYFLLSFNLVGLDNGEALLKRIHSGTGFACIYNEFVIVEHNGKILVCLFDQVESLTIDHKSFKCPSSVQLSNQEST